MTMSYLSQGLFVAGIVNPLLLGAWYIGRTAYQRKEWRGRRLRELKQHYQELQMLMLTPKDAPSSGIAESIANLEKQIKFLEQAIEPSLLSLNHPDFGAMFISVAITEIGILLLCYTGGIFYYIGTLLIFAGASSSVWTFSGMASSLGGLDEVRGQVVANLTRPTTTSALAEKALNTSQEALALSNEAVIIARDYRLAAGEAIPVARYKD
jgi:hypothetical protein